MEPKGITVPQRPQSSNVHIIKSTEVDISRNLWGGFWHMCLTRIKYVENSEIQIFERSVLAKLCQPRLKESKIVIYEKTSCSHGKAKVLSCPLQKQMYKMGKKKDLPESRAMNYGEQWARELSLEEKGETNEQKLPIPEQSKFTFIRQYFRSFGEW